MTRFMNDDSTRAPNTDSFDQGPRSESATLRDEAREAFDSTAVDVPLDKEDVRPKVEKPPSTAEGGREGDGEEDGSNEIVIDWDGPDDPQNPRNWSYKRKWGATFIVSAFTFISPVSSSMVAPATRQIASQFGITSQVIEAMTTSIFVLAYAIGPLFLGPLSEIFGRSRVLQLANMWYLVWNLVCGFAQNTGQLIAFRFLAGLGGSAPLSIGGGVLGDLWAVQERGQAIALYSLAPLLGPVVGPVAGAWIAERSTWRWVFWSTTIVDGIIQCFGLLYLRETYAPILLGQKASRIRKEMDIEKGGRDVRTVYDTADRHWKSIFKHSLTRPFLLFAYEPIIQLLGIYMAFIYGTMYLFLTTIPSIFEGVYGERVGIAGLHYIALGVGLTGASQINARLLDRIYAHFIKRNGGQGRPEYRLPSMVPGTILLPAGLFIAGWTARRDIHWIVPDIGIAFIGAGQILNFQSIQTYVIDAFTLHAASALAAVSCLRSLAGFGFPLFAPAMYNALGFGKGDTILACAAIVIGCPAPWVFWHFGERIRKASRYARS
ncbi:MFS polyamine transporter [Gloeophyllum trabeum ATCC 11539]|uniref:MFS polyamine transporter n=1 Tax=Gloeophyllum trabeum (strain ATCC 11539 / FP-39264 / Madison 617) TaxID=670483 RepID=S7R7K8_GLOTA|nr:MFS polyamine transporter [Gloeophyllum trabeum ATCC 11539]EPQ50360.1 MFS polyamine transporter [Gloeophyllum trabeum ATCC 11539]